MEPDTAAAARSEAVCRKRLSGTGFEFSENTFFCQLIMGYENQIALSLGECIVVDSYEYLPMDCGTPDDSPMNI